MSIWSSCGGVENCWDGEYHSERSTDNWVDIADSSYAPGHRMRLSIDSDHGHGCIALDRDQAQQLVQDISDWLTLAETGQRVWELAGYRAPGEPPPT